MAFIRHGRSAAVNEAGAFEENPLPSGGLSFTVTWGDVSGESGYLIYVSTASQTYPDSSLYTYRYLAAANATSRVISSVQSGTKYVRVAGYEGSTVGDLSHEVTYTPA